MVVSLASSPCLMLSCIFVFNLCHRDLPVRDGPHSWAMGAYPFFGFPSSFNPYAFCTYQQTQKIIRNTGIIIERRMPQFAPIISPIDMPAFHCFMLPIVAAFLFLGTTTPFSAVIYVFSCAFILFIDPALTSDLTIVSSWSFWGAYVSCWRFCWVNELDDNWFTLSALTQLRWFVR